MYLPTHELSYVTRPFAAWETAPSPTLEWLAGSSPGRLPPKKIGGGEFLTCGRRGIFRFFFTPDFSRFRQNIAPGRLLREGRLLASLRFTMPTFYTALLCDKCVEY